MTHIAAAPTVPAPSALTPRSAPVPISLDLNSGMRLGARNTAALRDVAEALRMWRLSAVLAWLDIKLRYRGSVLGPFWLTLSTGVMVGSLGGLYSTLFHMQMATYLPFISLSLVLWGFLSGLVSEACTCFTQAESMIRSARMPFTLHAARSVIRNYIVLAHNVVVIAATFAWYGVSPGTVALETIPALALWTLDGLLVCLMLGMVCARFRDVPPIVGSVMQIAFFLSAIIWTPDQVGGNVLWLQLNPFFALIEIVRAPLLSGGAQTLTWISALGWSAALCGASWLLFTRVRGRLAFWI